MYLNFSFQNIPKDIFKYISFFLKMNDVVSLGLSSKKQSKLIKTSIHKYISEKRWYYKSLTKLPVKLYKHVTLFDCRHRHEVKSNLINLKCLFLRFNTLIPTLMFQPTLTHLTIGGVVPPRPIEPVLPTIGFNRPIEPGLLPTSLTHLTLGGDFKQPIGIGVLPPNLTFNFRRKFQSTNWYRCSSTKFNRLNFKKKFRSNNRYCFYVHRRVISNIQILSF